MGNVVSIFFDLKKAYDTTWNYSIMKDIYTYNMDFKGRLPLFFQKILSQRKFIDSSWAHPSLIFAIKKSEFLRAPVKWRPLVKNDVTSCSLG